MKKLKKILKSNPKIHFLLYKCYLPFKRFKNRKNYDHHYSLVLNRLKEVKNYKKIFYVGIPIHSNLGDLAQYYCISKWLTVNYPEYKIVEIPDNILCHNHKNLLKKMKEFVQSDDLFVFQSGYRTTDVANFEGEYAHQKILKNFENRVLVFPQTVYFKDSNEIRKSSEAYKQHHRYLFLARDEISYTFAKKMYDEEKVLLYPDIVTSLIGNTNIADCDQERDGILFCLRNDEEKLYSNDEYKKIIEGLKKITDKIDCTDTNSNLNFEFDRSMVEKEVMAKVNQFSKYQLIITDRYHGTIFSLISNTPVIVLNSTDHKLSSGVDWFKEIYHDAVYYCKSLEDVPVLVEKIYNKKRLGKLASHFNNQYYSCLKDTFDEKVK